MWQGKAQDRMGIVSMKLGKLYWLTVLLLSCGRYPRLLR